MFEERLYRNDKLPGHRKLYFCLEEGENSYCEFLVTSDYGRQFLWARCRFYGRCIDVNEGEIPKEVVDRLSDSFFPISKWGIEQEDFPSMVDGRYLVIEYHGGCNVMLSGSKFDRDAANEMVDLIYSVCKDIKTADLGYHMSDYKECHARALFDRALSETDYSASTWEQTARYIGAGETQPEKDARAEELHSLLRASATEEEFVQRMKALILF